MHHSEMMETLQNLVHMKVDSELRPCISESLPNSLKDLSAFGCHKNLDRGNAKIFTCDVCKKEFKTSSNLSAHKKFHSDEHLRQMRMLNSLAVLNAKRLSRLKE